MILPQATVNSAPSGADAPFLPPGTRFVLEIPDPAAPSGFRCVTPTMDEVLDTMAAGLGRRLRERARAADAPPAPAHPPREPLALALPVCTECGVEKTCDKAGKFRCSACHAEKMRQSWARRKAVTP